MAACDFGVVVARVATLKKMGLTPVTIEAGPVSGKPANEFVAAQMARKLPGLNFDQAKLGDVLASLRKDTVMNLSVDLPGLAAVGTTPESKVTLKAKDVPVAEALGKIAEAGSTAKGKLAFVVGDEGVVILTTEEVVKKGEGIGPAAAK